MIWRPCLRRQVRFDLCRAVIWTRQASTESLARPARIDSPSPVNVGRLRRKPPSLPRAIRPQREQRTQEHRNNSYELVARIKNIVFVENDPDQAVLLLQKSRYAGAEYAWNILLKYHSANGQFGVCQRIYQIMKKCSARPNLDTYIQLAIAINNMHLKYQDNVRPRSRYILDVVKNLLAEDFPVSVWRDDRRIGLFLSVLKKSAFVAIENNKPEGVAAIVEASKQIWSFVNPFNEDLGRIRMSDENSGLALSNHLWIMSLSKEREDWKNAVPLLEYLKDDRLMIENCQAAITLADLLGDLALAEKYWDYFWHEPFDLKSAKKMLIMYTRKDVKKSGKSGKAVLRILVRALKETPKIPTDFYSLALISCLRPHDVRHGIEIFELATNDRRITEDVNVYSHLISIMLDLYARYVNPVIPRERAVVILLNLLDMKLSRYFKMRNIDYAKKEQWLRKIEKVAAECLERISVESKPIFPVEEERLAKVKRFTEELLEDLRKIMEEEKAWTKTRPPFERRADMQRIRNRKTGEVDDIRLKAINNLKSI